MASCCFLQHIGPGWDQRSHPIQRVYWQQNSPKKILAATGRGAESGVSAGKRDSTWKESAAEATAAADTKTEAVPGSEKLHPKQNLRHLLQMPQSGVW